jgi:hypothetical protein
MNLSKFRPLFLFTSAGLMILFYFLTNHFELFPRVGWVDAGMYSSYANNNNLIRDYGFSGNSYQGTRLGYIVPAKIFSSTFGPINGRYLLVLTYYFSSLFALFLGVKKLTKRVEIQALFMTVVICNPLLLAGISYGGTDGPAAAYIIFATIFLLYSLNTTRTKIYLYFSGLFAALSFSSHILTIAPLGLFLIAYLILSNNDYKARISAILLGFVSTIFCMSLIGYALGMEHNYLTYSLSWGVQSAKGVGLSFTQPFAEVFTHSLIYIPPLFLIITAISRCGSFKNIMPYCKQNSHGNFILASLLFSAGPLMFFVLYDKVLGGAISQYISYYQLFYPCFIFSFLFLLIDSNNNISANKVIIINFMLLILFIFSALNVELLYSILFVLSSIIIFGLVLFVAEKETKKFAISTCLLIALFAFQYLCYAYNNSITPLYHIAGTANTKELYISQLEFMRTINKLQKAYSLPYFVFDKTANKKSLPSGQFYHTYFNGKKNIYNYFDSLTALYLWDRSILSDNPYAIDFKKIVATSDKLRQIVIIGKEKSEVNTLYTRVASQLKEPQIITSKCYKNKYYPWCITVVKEFPAKAN